MPFSKPRILTESESLTIRGKCLAGHASKEEIMSLISHFDLVDMELRGALTTLSGCLPEKVFVYGSGGEQWSDTEPEHQQFELVDFEKVLSNIA